MVDCFSPCEIVSDGWSRSQIYARDALNEVYAYLNDISATVSDINIPSGNVGLTVPLLKDITIELPDEPSHVLASYNAPVEPVRPALGVLSDLSVPSVPEFLALYPDVSLPSAPLPLTTAAPSDSPNFNPPTTPTSPDIDIPPVPTLSGLSLPTLPDINMAEFTALVPTEAVGSIIADVSFREDPYASSALTAVNSKLLYDINNGTAGLPEVIETAIWERAKDRELAETRKAKRAAVREFADRGFSLPGGILEERIREADEEMTMKSISLSREAAVNQAERALQQLQFALTTAVQLENTLIGHASQMAQRTLEASTTAANVGIQVYQAKVQAYSARWQAYSSYATAFKIRTDAELSKLEEYRALLEGQRVKGELNLQQIEVYKAQLQSIDSIVRVYSTEMEAAKVEADIQATALRAFSEKVNAYNALVNAKSQEFNGYASQIQGEALKVQLYEGEVNAYNSRINAYRSLVEAKKTESDANLAVKQLQVGMYQADLEAFRAKVQAEATRITADVQQFQSLIQAYSAKAGVRTEQARVDQAENESRVRMAGVEADIKLKSAEVEISRALNSLNAVLGAMQNGANVTSQLAASALSAVSLQGSISGSSSTNYSYSGTI